MPELPEVETVCRGLRQAILSKKIQSIVIRETRLREPLQPEKLHNVLPGKIIEKIDRRAKYIIISLSGGFKILAHLGMSGQIVVQARNENYRKHDHIILYLSDELQMRFHDPRRFGMFALLHAHEVETHPRLKNLGYEPLEIKTTPALTWPQVKKSKKPIKNLLMDASFIVGVGNIYANEALFFSGVHPQKIAGKLSENKWKAILQQVKIILDRAIEQGGTTLNDFVNSSGENGYFQLELAVYGREAQPCKSCLTPIKRIVQSGRSTFFCPQCQRK